MPFLSFPTVPWALALVFILALVLIARLRSVISSISKQSYNNLSWGLVLLALFSLGRVYHDLGLMASVPFLSEATFFQLIYAIGMISGAVFVLSGVSEFLPLSNKQRQYDETKLTRIELLKQVEQLIGVENRLDHLLESTLTHIVDSFKYDFGAVFKFSSRSGVARLAALSGTAPASPEAFESIRFNPKAMNGSAANGSAANGAPARSGLTTKVIENIPEQIDQPHTFVPLLAGNEPVGFFLLWQEKADQLKREDHQVLKIVADIISRKIISDRNNLKYEFVTRGEALARRLQSESKLDSNLKEALQAVTEIVGEDVSFKMLTLTILDGPGGSLRRLTVGSSGAVLDEKGLAPSERRAISKAVITAGTPFIVDDYDPEHALIGEDILDSGTMRSALCVPVTDDHRIVAVIMIADEAPNQYRQRDAVMLSYSTTAVAQMIRDENYRTTVLRREKRISRITRFVKDSQQATSFDQTAQAAAELIADELATCQVRVSLVGTRGRFLKSCGLASKREIATGVPADGEMILSLMPCHTEVLNSGKQLIVKQVDQDSASMPESESSQVLNTALNSAMIIPIMSRERVIGMISIAEMRNWQQFQFDQADIIFTEALAEILSLSLAAATESSYHLPSSEPRISQAIVSDPVGRSRVRSSLTGILGSIELINSPGASDPEKMKRYLSIIDSSARKINEYLTAD